MLLHSNYRYILIVHIYNDETKKYLLIKKLLQYTQVQGTTKSAMYYHHQLSLQEDQGIDMTQVSESVS